MKGKVQGTCRWGDTKELECSSGFYKAHSCRSVICPSHPFSAPFPPWLWSNAAFPPPPSSQPFSPHAHPQCLWALASTSHHTWHIACSELPAHTASLRKVNNFVRYGFWGFPCSALGHHPFLYQPPEPRIKQMNELQSIRIILCLCNPSSSLLV